MNLVTGGTSIIGQYLIEKLLDRGESVRLITRKNMVSWHENLEIITGDLSEIETIVRCLKGVDCVFHCAAEFSEQSKIWEINVGVTELLIKEMRKHRIDYFCHISSAGVLGAFSDALVDESTICYPRDLYEKSKFEAEKSVMSSQLKASVCVLRPVFVVSPERPGFVKYPIRNNWKDKLMIRLKGREQAHLVHASDVAEAAVFFKDKNLKNPECFYVACDDNEMNTLGGIYACYRSLSEGRSWPEKYDIPFCGPRILPHIIRYLLRGPSLHGRVRFSSAKLIKFGFSLPMGFEESIKDIWKSQKK